MSHRDLGQRLSALPIGARMELLNLLSKPDAVRADAIGRLYSRDGARLLAELLMDLERSHNDRFRTLMDKFMPSWRLHRDELNRSPLAHEDWIY